MKTYVLRCDMLAPVGIEEAFAVFEDPYNLARITPPWLNFKVTSKVRVVMTKGAAIDYTIRWMGLPIKWKTNIAEYDPPHCFVDEQTKGPYVLWHHTHRFAVEGSGTRVSDEVRYALPFGPIGKIAHEVMVGRQLREIFEYRQQTLPRLIGGETSRYRSSSVMIHEAPATA